MNHESFLAAIRASPDDDTTRLVYADWLDDQGDSTRAEFIRSAVASKAMDPDDPRRPVLEQRQRDILEANEARWLGSMPLSVLDWTYRGGLVERIVLKTGSRPMLDDLVARHPIHHVTLVGATNLSEIARGAWLQQISALTHGQWETVPSGPLNAIELRALLRSPHLGNLTRLGLRSGAINHHFVEIMQASSIRSLRTLALADTGLYDADIAPLLRTAQLSALDDFSVQGGMVSPLCLEQLAANGPRWRGLGVMAMCPPETIARLSGCINLRRLALTLYAQQRTPLPALPALEEVSLNTPTRALGSLEVLDPHTPWPSSLRRLCLWTPHLDSPASTQALSELLDRLPRPALELSVQHLLDDRPQPWSQELAHLERITRLEINDLGLTRGLSNGVGLTGLRELILNVRPSMPDDHLGQMVRSPDWQRLQQLHLSARALGAGTVRALVESRYLTRLRDLTLRGSLTSACLEMLASWPGLRRLDRLELDSHFIDLIDLNALQALVHSPNLSPLTQVWMPRLRMTPVIREAFRERLGWRFHG